MTESWYRYLVKAVKPIVFSASIGPLALIVQ